MAEVFDDLVARRLFHRASWEHVQGTLTLVGTYDVLRQRAKGALPQSHIW